MTGRQNECFLCVANNVGEIVWTNPEFLKLKCVPPFCWYPPFWLDVRSGALDVKMAPKAVTLREESELQAMLDRLALEQEEVDGDAPDDV